MKCKRPQICRLECGCFLIVFCFHLMHFPFSNSLHNMATCTNCPSARNLRSKINMGKKCFRPTQHIDDESIIIIAAIIDMQKPI
ncbi:hypothetical protein RJT34_14412 [Clitoria ternatea]|uniref:Uncharacterized protein n=1 Tax=Clitoria ternatea TaxID=43366 RepID=A0AAN9JQD3_CLITE